MGVVFLYTSQMVWQVVPTILVCQLSAWSWLPRAFTRLWCTSAKNTLMY